MKLERKETILLNHVAASENRTCFECYFSFLQFCEFMSLCCLMHLAGRVVRILLDYVSHVPICLKLRLILEKQQEWPEICDIHGELCNYVRTCIQSLCAWLR